MEAHQITIKETVSASKKLGRREATAMAKEARRVVVAKGKKVNDFKHGGKVNKEIIDAMLGPTGNLRAPLMRVGKTLLVGFNPDAYEEVFG